MNEKVNCTMEEINLMCVYDTDNRYILIEEMENALPFVKDREMRSLMRSTLSKLYATNDDDYSNLPLFPTWEDYNDDDEIPGLNTSSAR